MKKNKEFSDNILPDGVECLGNFNPADNFCMKFCTLKLRCAIEQNQMSNMDRIEDFIYANDSFQIHL